MKDKTASATLEIAATGIGAREAQIPLTLALDVGTSSVRAALYDAAGREIADTQARLARSFCTTADGGAEIDAEESVGDVVRVVDEALRQAAELRLRIEAVAASCFWHSLVGVGANGRALTPVFGWADTRAADVAEDLRRRFDERAVHARTGCRFHASYWPAKLLWLRRERAEVFRAVTHWLSFSEFLARRLCHEQAASVSMASGTGLLNQHGCAWDEELLDALSLKLDQLPPLLDDKTTFKVAGEYAGRWPQLRGVPVFAAIGDGAANNVGANCVNARAAALMIGTSGAMRVMYEGAPPAALPASLWSYRVDRRRVIVGGALSDGGGLYAWMRDAFKFDDHDREIEGDEQEIERELSAMPPDAHGLTLLPFWAGERSTGWQAHACGAILGLTMHTRPAQILRAAMEAVAYRFAQVAEALQSVAPHAEVRASGGALSASRAWTQIVADVLNRSVQLSRGREASSRGVALLALEALGALERLPDAPTDAGEIYHPDAPRHARYRAGLARQELIYKLLLNDPNIARMLNDATSGGWQARECRD